MARTSERAQVKLVTQVKADSGFHLEVMSTPLASAMVAETLTMGNGQARHHFLESSLKHKSSLKHN